MGNLVTLLGGATLGAGGMYFFDPRRGPRRRARLLDVLGNVDTDELVERARRLEPVRHVRQLGGGLRPMLEQARWTPASRAPRWLSRRGVLGRRRRHAVLQARDWALLGGLVGAIAAGLWLARRWSGEAEGIEVVRTMTVDAPVERVFEFWSDFENFPRFMSHVREVERTGPDRTHWTVAGPGGTPIEWDAVVTRRVANEEIGWRTVAGSPVEHGGAVRFRPAASNRTRIEVRMTYRPVGGVLGHGLAALFGSDPERVIADDLARLSTHIRGGRAAVGEPGSPR
jgi:uncharacterized membrane protein